MTGMARPVPGLLLFAALALTACAKSDVDPQKAEFGALQRPSKLPAFVKIFPGGHVHTVMEFPGGATRVSYLLDADPVAVEAFYRDAALKNGLDQQARTTTSTRFDNGVDLKFTHQGQDHPYLYVSVMQFAKEPLLVVVNYQDD